MQSIAFASTHVRPRPASGASAIGALAGLFVLFAGDCLADTRVAVIASQTAEIEKLAPLVELRLGQTKGIVLLEREALKQILSEQELQALMTAEGTAKRIALGKLLKADVFVILQGETKPRPHARVVICETQQGLRFCNQRVELSKTIETDTDAVVTLVDRAVEKQQHAITDIVAVPPFVNNTLAYEGEHLKGAYACLIEEMLLDQPGVLVVELAEARAIGQEMAVVGASTATRRDPLYFMGDYRLDGTRDKNVTLTLRLLRGATELDRRQVAGGMDEMPALLRQAAGEMFSKALGQKIGDSNAEQEIKNLVERSNTFARLANWEEALALTEAALLLKPKQSGLHNDALRCLNAILKTQEDQERHATFVNLQPDGPTKRLALMLLPATLYHMESSLMLDNAVSVSPPNEFPGGFACEYVCNWLMRTTTSDVYEKRMTEFEPILAMARRVLAAKAASKVQDASLWVLWRYAEIPSPMNCSPNDISYPTLWQARFRRERMPAIRENRLRLLDKFGYLKGERDWRSLFFDDTAPPHDPTYVDFLYRVKELPHLRQTAEFCLNSYLSQGNRSRPGQQ